MTNALTRSGRIEGRRERALHVFRGIPYARPPLGPLSFRAPEPPKPWAGVRPALRFGPSAPQAGAVARFVRQMIGTSAAQQSRDCLYLNVWTPGVDGARRPVLVWIHGGAFVMGSGATALYGGARLARRGDVVVVTLNYRLGALGFLCAAGLPGGESFATNIGIRDQIAALEWVRDNIAELGGDPENVTIFGESAGGMSVGTLLGTPGAQGLFRRAVCQSGAAHNVSTPEQAHAVVQCFLESLGLREDELERLRELPVGELLRAQAEAAGKLGFRLGVLPWQPCVDGDLLPETPRAAVAKGIARGVPLLVGTNRDEWKLFMLADAKGRSLDKAGLRRRLERALPGRDADGESLADRAYETYRRVPGPRGELPSERWSAFQSDRIFHYPAAQLAELQAAHAPTYAYLFAWSPPLLGSRIGACHGLEIPFVFGTLREPWMRAWLGATPGAQRLSKRMQESWLRFARSGDPGTTNLPRWPVYEASRRASLRFASQCSIHEAPFETGRRFWQPILA